MDGSGIHGEDGSKVGVHTLIGQLVWVALRTGAEGADNEITPQPKLVKEVIGNNAKLEGGEMVSIAQKLSNGTWAGECFVDKDECLLWCRRTMRHLSLVRYVRRWNWLGPNFKSEDPHNN